MIFDGSALAPASSPAAVVDGPHGGGAGGGSWASGEGLAVGEVRRSHTTGTTSVQPTSTLSCREGEALAPASGGLRLAASTAPVSAEGRPPGTGAFVFSVGRRHDDVTPYGFVARCPSCGWAGPTHDVADQARPAIDAAAADAAAHRATCAELR